MCGIAGAIGVLDTAVIAAVRRASDAEVHRGPDADGFWTSGGESGPGVALAHRRLSILDLSADGTQPMLDPKSGVVIVYNGEVYNFAALRSELEAGGASFRSKTDTEVLIHAYVQWGPEFVSRLRGMFAFALWDPRRRRLLIVRDRVGIKPVYVARLRRPSGDVVLFASELRALLATGLVERRLDPIGLQTQLWHGFPVGPGTLVRGVRRLEAGTSLAIDLDDDLRETSHRYWTLPARGEPPRPRRLGVARRARVGGADAPRRRRPARHLPLGRHRLERDRRPRGARRRPCDPHLQRRLRGVALRRVPATRARSPKRSARSTRRSASRRPPSPGASATRSARSTSRPSTRSTPGS